MPGLGIGIGFPFASKQNAPYYTPLNGAFSCVAIHPKNCFSDASHVVNCNDGDAVRWIKDNNGTFHEQATSGARPILRADAGRYYLEFDGVSTFFDLTFTLSQNSNFIYGAAVQIEQNTAYGMALSINSEREFQQNNNNPQWLIGAGAGNILLHAVSSLGVNRILIANVGASGGAGTTYFLVDGTPVANAVDTSVITTISSVKLGRRNGTTSYTFNGRLYGYCILPGTTQYTNSDIVFKWLHNCLPTTPYLIDRFTAENATYTGALPANVVTLPGARRTLTPTSGNIQVHSGGVNSKKYITFTGVRADRLAPATPFNMAPPYTIYSVVDKVLDELIFIHGYQDQPPYNFHVMHGASTDYAAVGSPSALIGAGGCRPTNGLFLHRITHLPNGVYYIKGTGFTEQNIAYTYAWQRKGMKYLCLGSETPSGHKFYDQIIVAGDVRGTAYETNLLAELNTLYGVTL